MGPLTFLGKSPRDEVGFYMDRGEWFRVGGGGGANPDLWTQGEPRGYASPGKFGVLKWLEIHVIVLACEISVNEPMLLQLEKLTWKPR